MSSVQTPTPDSHRSKTSASGASGAHDRGLQGFRVPSSSDAKGWGQLARPILTFVGAVVLVTAIVSVVMSQRNSKAATGRDALYLARKTLEGEVKAVAKTEIPASALEEKADAKKDPKAPKKTPEQEKAEKQAREERALADAAEKLSYRKLDVDSKFPEGVKKLKAVSEEFKGTRPGFEATLALGNLYADHGDAAKAAPWFEKAAEQAPGGLERSLAYAAIGYAQETQGQNQEALKSFETGLKSSEGVVKADLLLSIARTQLALSNAAKAKESLDQVISQFPGTEQAKAAELQKAQLE